jgi:hypothetical protein
MNGSGRLIGVGAQHVEILVNPASVSNTKVTSDSINLRDWDHVTLLLHFGSIHDSLDSDLTIYGDSDASLSDTTALATINYRVKICTAAWGSMAQVTDSKLDVVSGGDIGVDDDQLVAIEIDTADILALSSSVNLDYVHFEMSAGGAYAYLLGAVAILSKGRYTQDPPASAL